MKKILFTPLCITLPIIGTISCSSSSPDYKVMSFTIDINKAKTLNVSEFNNEPITKEKLAKVTKTDINNFDKYTLNALGYSASDDYKVQNLNNNVFEAININGNILTIKLKAKYKKGDKEVDSVYRLPNNSLKMTIDIK